MNILRYKVIRERLRENKRKRSNFVKFEHKNVALNKKYIYLIVNLWYVLGEIRLIKNVAGENYFEMISHSNILSRNPFCSFLEAY